MYDDYKVSVDTLMTNYYVVFNLSGF